MHDARREGMEVEKVWGRMWRLHLDRSSSVHLIHVKPGGHCSTHYHAKKFNAFVVVRGQLLVATYDFHTKRRRPVSMVVDGGCFSVPPGTLHSFAALSEVIAYEVYTAKEDSSPVEETDIVRVGDILGGVSLAFARDMWKGA